MENGNENSLDEELLGLLEAPPSHKPSSSSYNHHLSNIPSNSTNPPPNHTHSNSNIYTNTNPPKKHKKRRRKKQDSDDDNDDDDDDDEENQQDSTYSTSEISSLSSLSDVDILDGEPFMEEGGRGSGILDENVGNLELEGLTEFQREVYLSERAEKRQAQLERLAIRQRLKSVKSSSSALKNGGERGERGDKGRGGSRGDVRLKNKSRLEELRAKREKKKGKKGGVVEGDVMDEEVDVDVDGSEFDYADRIRSAISKGSGGEHSFNESSGVLSRVDLLGVQVSREELIKWMFAPFFESRIIGCYVRLGLGKDKTGHLVYRLCQIIKVKEYHRVYRIDSNTQAKVALVLKHGKSEKDFLIDVVSNGHVTEMEFQRWLKTMQTENQRLPSFSELKRLSRGLESARNHVFTSEEVSAMIDSKQRVLPVAKNLAIEKLHLLAQKEEAETQGREEDARRIENDIRSLLELEATHTVEDSKGNVWESLNERNRKRNLEEGRQSELRIRGEKIASLKSGKTHDPFARIKALAPSDHILNPDEKLISPITAGPVSPILSGTYGNGNLMGSVVQERKGSVTTDAFDEVFSNVDFDI